MTYYVRRGKHGVVTAAWSEPQYRVHDSVPSDDPALLRYLNRTVLSQRLAAVGLTVDDIATLAVRVGMYVERDPDGLVVGAWPEPRRDMQELLPFDDRDLQAFLAPSVEKDAA